MHIIADTREQQPWDFEGFDEVQEIISAKLDTGDYSLVGLEDKVCIERKKSVSEIANNVNQDRFWKEMDRLKEFEYSFVLLEFSIDDILAFPVGSTVPKRLWNKIRVKGPYILKKMTQIQTRYGIHVVYCGDVDNAQTVAVSILKEVNKKYGSD